MSDPLPLPDFIEQQARKLVVHRSTEPQTKAHLLATLVALHSVERREELRAELAKTWNTWRPVDPFSLPQTDPDEADRGGE